RRLAPSRTPRVERRGASYQLLLGDFLHAISCVLERLWTASVEFDLIHARVAPTASRAIRDRFAPVRDGLVLCGCAFPYTPLRFDNPVDLTTIRLLHDDPIRMVETDRPAWLQVVNAEARA